MDDNIADLVDSLAGPVFAYRMARGRLCGISNNPNAINNDAMQQKSAERRMANAERQIGKIVREWVAAHPVSLEEAQ